MPSLCQMKFMWCLEAIKSKSNGFWGFARIHNHANAFFLAKALRFHVTLSICQIRIILFQVLNFCIGNINLHSHKTNKARAASIIFQVIMLSGAGTLECAESKRQTCGWKALENAKSQWSYFVRPAQKLIIFALTRVFRQDVALATYDAFLIGAH